MAVSLEQRRDELRDAPLFIILRPATKQALSVRLDTSKIILANSTLHHKIYRYLNHFLLIQQLLG